MIIIYIHRSETLSSCNFAKKFQKIGNLPIRFIIILVSAFATTVQYTLRTILSVTIVAMVKKSTSNSTNDGNTLDSCPVDQPLNGSSNRLEGTFDWSPTLQGIVLGAFYYGYVSTTTYGGQLALTFGSRKLIGASILLSSILTIFIPWAAYYNVIAVIIFRIITGMAQGVMSPAQYTLIANWIPEEERSTALASLFVGGNIGSVVTMPFSGFMCNQKSAGGWHSVFYILGSFGILCFMLWIYFIRDNPEDHPFIKGKELLYIQKNIAHKKHPQTVPWLAMLKNRQTWIIAFVKCTWSWGYLTIVSKLPAYLESALHMPIENNGIVNSIMYLSLGISTFAMGYLSDFIAKRKLLTKNASRKMFECIAQLGSGICLSLIPAAGCSVNYIIGLLILCMILSGSMAGGENPVIVDLAPDFSGTLYGFTNAIASIPGFLAPLYVGFILDQSPSVKIWNYVFYSASIIYALGCLLFLVAGTTEPQTWGKLAEDKLEVQTYSKDSNHNEKQMPLPSPYFPPYSSQEQSRDLIQSEVSCQH